MHTVVLYYYNESEDFKMTNREKRKVAEMVTNEQKWLYDHPEYTIPQWYGIIKYRYNSTFEIQLKQLFHVFSTFCRFRKVHGTLPT